MCIVAWVPTEEGFTLFSNRDDRPAKAHLSNHRHKGNDFIVLLNGGLVNHFPKPPYRASRVEVLDTFFEFKHVEDFKESFVFKGMEPFTLVIYATERLQQVVWTGSEVLHHAVDKTVQHLWASSTLYTSEQQAQFKHQMEHALEEGNSVIEQIESLFQKQFQFPGNSFGTVTLSTTRVQLY